MKKIILLIGIVILLISSVNAAFDPAKPWHQIQQISGDGGSSSVDANQDGIIDYSTNAYTCNAGNICATNNLSSTGSSYLATSGGKVGIGTAVPNQKLHVIGNLNLSGFATIGSYLRIWDPVLTPGIVIDNNGSNDAPLYLHTQGDGTSFLNSPNTKGWAISARGDKYISANERNALEFAYWNSSDWSMVMILDNSSNVGIGPGNPNQRLTVSGNINSSGTVYASAFSSNSPLRLQTGGVNRIYANDTSGNVGIGTDIPGAKLDVAGNMYLGTGTNIYPSTPSSGNSLTLRSASETRMVMNDGTGNFQIYLNSYYDSARASHVCLVNNTQPVRLIMTSGAFQLLLANQTYFYNNTINSTTGWSTKIYANNAGVGINTTSVYNALSVVGNEDVIGSLGIGTTTPNQKLQVVGNVNATNVTGQTALCIGSDCRTQWPGGVGQGMYFFNSSTNWTVPAGVDTLFITAISGGQGGAGGGDGGNCGPYGVGAAGGTTSVGNLQVQGGGAYYNGIILASSATAGLGATAGSASPGGAGGSGIFGAGGAGGQYTGVFLPGAAGGLAAGGGGGCGQDSYGGTGGQSGRWVQRVFYPVNPLQNLTITIGAGSAGTAGCRSTGGAGGPGAVLIETFDRP